MVTSSAPHIVAVAATLTVLGLLVPGRWGESLFAVAAISLPALMLLLGEPRRGRAHRLIVAALASSALLVGGFVVLLLVAGDDPASVWLLGLPLGLAIQIYIMTFGPLLVIGLLYALDFERFRPRPRDLERIRSLADDGA